MFTVVPSVYIKKCVEGYFPIVHGRQPTLSTNFIIYLANFIIVYLQVYYPIFMAENHPRLEQNLKQTLSRLPNQSGD